MAKIPATENGPRVRCTTTDGKVYVISENLKEKKFTLWQKHDGEDYEKIATTTLSPIKLYEKIPWGDTTTE